MEYWRSYKKKAIQRMRQFQPGESLDGVSVSEPDKDEIAGLLSGEIPPEKAGMIAYNSENLNDRWYVAYKFFIDNYELTEDE